MRVTAETVGKSGRRGDWTQKEGRKMKRRGEEK